MHLTLHDLPPKVEAFARHCIENCGFKDVVEMAILNRHEDPCAQFDITLEQWQDAVYVVMKEMGR